MIDLLRQELEDAIAQIDGGNSNLNDDQICSLVEQLSYINKGIKRVSKAYACEHILHIDSDKFSYLKTKGIIPEGRHDPGFKEKSWRIADFDEALKYLSQCRKVKLK